MTVKAGRLIHRVSIENPVRAADGQGGQQRTGWAFAKAVWAEITPLDGREFITADRIVNGATHRVTMRYTAAVSHKSRLVFRDRVFQVAWIKNTLERNEDIVCLCKEVKR